MDNIDNILAKYFSSDLNTEESLIFKEWKKNNPEEFSALESIHKEAKPANFEHLFDVAEGWAETDKKIKGARQTKTVQLKAFRVRQWSIAASIVFLIGLGSIVFMNLNATVNVQTADFAKTIHLDDGSVVVLNKNTELAYPKKFDSQKRTLSLKGEAYFNVASNLEQPFEVSVDNILVTVLGTSFDIKSKEDDYTEVIVKTGKVSVYSEIDSKEVILLPGEKAIYHKNQLVKAPNENNKISEWKTGVLIFEDKPLSQIIIELEKYYKNRIVVEGDISKCYASVVFDKQTLEDALKELQLLFGFEIKENKNNTFTLNHISTCQ
ncbi:FecR domain-containing protein [Galbibacter sp. EGI 63066]|uniref:FecR family protein n=1 Tax=Galbibacter sp. EGI 63066 TaxID=2993559 RepID=UPI0022492FEF|nr:FecR domain-containing protein [Galbibacter sp. EGI 63066]MCX2681990.1 FecR domain-containing protein [Galbibacter sp. EGI 63066]